jgi:hypothetical protein
MRSILDLFERLKDELVQCGVQECVVDWTSRHALQHLSVLLDFVFLKPVDGHLPVVDGNEIDQLSVVLNVHVSLLNGSL